MQTLLLDLTNWDLCVDANGNIAVASNPYSVAQDAASEIRTFKGEVWYDTTRGLPYLVNQNVAPGTQFLLGSFPAPVSLIKADMIAAVVDNVPDVISATVFLSSLTNRGLTGQIQITAKPGTPPIALDF